MEDLRQIINKEAITLDLRPEVKEVVRTPCCHFYHAKCLDQWMKTRDECPTCRRNL